MSNLTYRDKRQLEDLFGMKSGYVLDFSDRTFGEFMRDVAGIDIFDEKYAYASGSKANRLRAFWTEESDEVLTPVLDALIEWAEDVGDVAPEKLDSARKIVDRLKGKSLSESRGTSDAQVEGAARSSVGKLGDLRYDVALSFAGEQRAYVNRVANILRSAGVSVFYDEFADLWGKDLAVELERVYRSNSRYVVVFVSQAYVTKAWTNHERQHALAGRIERQDDSILPVHFDGTRLPGLPTSVGYLDIRDMPAEELAARIQRKLSNIEK